MDRAGKQSQIHDEAMTRRSESYPTRIFNRVVEGKNTSITKGLIYGLKNKLFLEPITVASAR